MPDDNYDIIYKYGIEAIPTLLKQILVDDVHSKVGPNGYIFVSACLIERITNDINPLNWDVINKTELDQGLISVSQKYDYFNAIVSELKKKDIVDCCLEKDSVFCKKI